MKKKLTIGEVKSAKPGDKRYTVFDTEIRGFGLRVFPSGQKSWIFEYKSLEGGRRASTKRVTLGKAVSRDGMSVLTPSEARSLASNLWATVRLKGDPLDEQRQKREAEKLSDLISDFLKKHVEPKRTPRTFELYTDVLQRIVVPALGSRRAVEIKRSDMSKLHLAWSHTPFQANRMLAIVGSLYAWAQTEGRVPEDMNPARKIEKFKETHRERLLTAAELERLGDALREAETVGVPIVIDPDKKAKHVPKSKRVTTISPHAAAAIRLLLFTGARLREILHLKWEQVNLERGLLVLPTSKTGQKTIILNAPALSVLSELPKIGAYVIAGDSAGTDNEKPRADLKRPWSVVTRHAGIEDLRIHDLRHNFASFGVGSNMGLPVIGKLLGHATPATTNRYSHLGNDPLQQAANVIGSKIADALGEGLSGDENAGLVVDHPLIPKSG